MSFNCIRCITNKRTGADLLCDVCRRGGPKLAGVLHAMLAEMVPVACSPLRAGELAALIDSAFPPATPPATAGPEVFGACSCGKFATVRLEGITYPPDRKVDTMLLCRACWTRMRDGGRSAFVVNSLTQALADATCKIHGEYDARLGACPTCKFYAPMFDAPPPPGSSPQEGEGPIGLVQRPDGRWDIMRGDYECYSIKYGDWVGIGTSTPHSNGAIMDERVAAAVAAVLRSNGKENGACGSSSLPPRSSPEPRSGSSSPGPSTCGTGGASIESGAVTWTTSPPPTVADPSPATAEDEDREAAARIEAYVDAGHGKHEVWACAVRELEAARGRERDLAIREAKLMIGRLMNAEKSS